MSAQASSTFDAVVAGAGPAGASAAAVLAASGLTGIGTGVGEVTAELGDLAPERVCAALVHEGVAVRGFAVVRPSLEDVFVGLTGEGFDVEA